MPLVRPIRQTCPHRVQMPDDCPLATQYSFLLVPCTGEYYFRVTRPGPGYPCAFDPPPLLVRIAITLSWLAMAA